MSKTKEDILWSFPQGESEPYGHVPIKRIYEAMDIYAKQEAIEFMKFNAREIAKYLNYCKRVQEAVTDEEIEKALNTFENANIEARYQLYLQSKQP